MELNRVDVIASLVSEMIGTLSPEMQGRAYIHLFGTAQAAALIATKRKVNVELAQICALLHDYYKYKVDYNDENHAAKGADMILPILAKSGLFNVCEIGNIVRAITCHSEKDKVGQPLDEVLKDADILQNVMKNVTKPIKPKYAERYEKLKAEFSL